MVIGENALHTANHEEHAVRYTLEITVTDPADPDFGGAPSFASFDTEVQLCDFLETLPVAIDYENLKAALAGESPCLVGTGQTIEVVADREGQ